MDDVLAEVDALKARWMTGGSAAGQGPANWRDLDELSLLAMTGQYTRMATRPQANDGGTIRAPLPRLALPPLADETRTLFRRLMEDKAVHSDSRNMMLRLVTQRGYTAHPGDWLPKANDDVPDVYGPWLDWVVEAAPQQTDAALTPETWDLWTPYGRFHELKRMTRDDRATARQIIEQVATSVPAEQRLRLFQTLQHRLSVDDADLLNAFSEDRSSKVATLCKNLLARLGKRQDDAAATHELVDFLEIGKSGLLRRQPKLGVPKMKSRAQENRFRELLASASLQGLSDAVGLGVEDIAKLWPLHRFGDTFAMMVANSAQEPVVISLTERVIDEGASHMIHPLVERLSPEARAALAPKAMKRDNLTFSLTAECLSDSPGSLPYEMIARDAHELAKPPKDDKQAHRHASLVAEGLINLGLIVDRPAAARLLEDLTNKGFIAADPSLTMLRLNASLGPETPA